MDPSQSEKGGVPPQKSDEDAEHLIRQEAMIERCDSLPSPSASPSAAHPHEVGGLEVGAPTQCWLPDHDPHRAFSLNFDPSENCGR